LNTSFGACYSWNTIRYQINCIIMGHSFLFILSTYILINNCWILLLSFETVFLFTIWIFWFRLVRLIISIKNRFIIKIETFQHGFSVLIVETFSEVNIRYLGQILTYIFSNMIINFRVASLKVCIILFWRVYVSSSTIDQSIMFSVFT